MESPETFETMEAMLQRLTETLPFERLARHYPYAEILLNIQDGCYVTGHVRVTTRAVSRSRRRLRRDDAT